MSICESWHCIHIGDCLAYLLDACLTHKTIYDHLVKHVAQLMRIENQVDLAYILENIVEDFNEDLDEVEYAKLAFFLVDDKDECKGGEGAEDYFALRRQGLTLADEVRLLVTSFSLLRRSCEKLLVDLFFGVAECCKSLLVVYSLQAYLTLVVNDQYGLNHSVLLLRNFILITAKTQKQLSL